MDPGFQKKFKKEMGRDVLQVSFMVSDSPPST